MPIIKPSTAFKAGADWVSAEVRAYMKDQTAIYVDTVQDVRDNDFEQARTIYVRSKAAFYTLNLSSSAADDGDTVLRDNIGRRYEKIAGSDGISIWNVAIDDLAARAAYDDAAAGFKVLVSDIGDGRSAIYTMGTGGSGDWSAPAYLTPADVGGDMVGPDSSTDNEIVVFDGTDGKITKGAGKSLSDLATAGQGAKADSAVQSVNGKTGATVTLSPEDVGAATAAQGAKTDPITVLPAAQNIPLFELTDADGISHGIVMPDETISTYRQTATGVQLVDGDRNAIADIPKGQSLLPVAGIEDAAFRIVNDDGAVIAEAQSNEQLLAVRPITDALLRVVDEDGTVYMEVGPDGIDSGGTGPITQTVYVAWPEPWSDPSESLTVTWVSDSATAKAVEYVVDGANAWQSAASMRSRAFPGLAGMYLHTTLLAGLSPATVYKLRFPGAEWSGKVRTTPKRDVAICLASDFHATDSGSRGNVATFGAITSNDVDLLILNGDHGYDDGLIDETIGNQWLAYLGLVTAAYRKDGAMIPIYLGVGNHEGRNAAGTSNALSGGDGTIGAIATIASCAYDPDQPNRRNNSAVRFGIGRELAIITLETDHTVPLIDQLPWFEEQLSAVKDAGYRHVCIVGHCPAFHGSTNALEFDSQSRVLRGYFWPAMEPYADLIRFYHGGHEHILGVTERLRMDITGTPNSSTNDSRFVADPVAGVRQIGNGPSGNSRFGLQAGKVDVVSSIDGTTVKFLAAMGYDIGTDSAQVQGDITNASTSEWNIWVARFHSDGGFEAQALGLAGLPYYTIDETL